MAKEGPITKQLQDQLRNNFRTIISTYSNWLTYTR